MLQRLINYLIWSENRLPVKLGYKNIAKTWVLIMNRALWQQHFPKFANNTDNALVQLMDAAVLIRLTSGQQVFYPGKPCGNYLLMLSGSIKAQIMSPEGKEVLLYHVLAGEACVLTTACLLGGDDYPAEGYAETPVSAFLIPAPIFHRCVDQSSLFREFVFRNLSKRLSDVIQRMESLAFGSIETKLVKWLLANNNQTIQVTHNELALELGTAREVVSRHLKRFESYGWLVLSRGSIQSLNRNALARLTDSGGDS